MSVVTQTHPGVIMKNSQKVLIGVGSLAVLTMLAIAGGPETGNGSGAAGKECQSCQKVSGKEMCETPTQTASEPTDSPAAPVVADQRKGTGMMRGRGMMGGMRGMSPEAHETIHGLFTNHDQFKREVTLTDEGYVSTTTSENSEMVKMIQEHMKQMESRLEKGLMVRRWDPAYEEFVNHYDDIDIRFKKIENGISVTAKGKTPAAVKVARNHAGIVSRFVAHGWDEHDIAHPTAADKETTPAIEGLKVHASAAQTAAIEELITAGKPATAQKACCRSEGGSNKECCLKEEPAKKE
jgi:hypothetical protein